MYQEEAEEKYTKHKEDSKSVGYFGQAIKEDCDSELKPYKIQRRQVLSSASKHKRVGIGKKVLEMQRALTKHCLRLIG